MGWESKTYGPLIHDLEYNLRFVYSFGLYHLWTLYPVLLASDKPWASKFVVPSFLVIGYLLNLLWSFKIARGLYSLMTKKKQK